MGKNPLYGQLNGNQAPGNGDQASAFRQFMMANRGKDPNEMIRQIVNSGRVSQAQLDQVQRMANKVASAFDGLRSSFGF